MTFIAFLIGLLCGVVVAFAIGAVLIDREQSDVERGFDEDMLERGPGMRIHANRRRLAWRDGPPVRSGAVSVTSVNSSDFDITTGTFRPPALRMERKP